MAKIEEFYKKAGVTCSENCSLCNETYDDKYEVDKPSNLENYLVGVLIGTIGFITGLNIGLWFAVNLMVGSM